MNFYNNIHLTFSTNSTTETLEKTVKRFKVNNKNTRTMSLASLWCRYCFFKTYFILFSSVSIVHFQQVSVSWVDPRKFMCVFCYQINCNIIFWLFCPQMIEANKNQTRCLAHISFRIYFYKVNLFFAYTLGRMTFRSIKLVQDDEIKILNPVNFWLYIFYFLYFYGLFVSFVNMIFFPE